MHRSRLDPRTLRPMRVCLEAGALGRALETGAAESRARGGIRSFVIPLETPEALSLGSEGFIIRTHDGAAFGHGCAMAIEVDGSRRGAQVRAQASGLEPDLPLFGGFAFEEQLADARWRGFGASRFVVPTAVVQIRGAATTLRVCWPSNQEAPLDEVRAWLTAEACPGLSVPSAVAREDAEAHRARVRAALRAFERGELFKVVMSRDTRVHGRFDREALVRALPGEPGPHARFAFSRGEACFAGQSPERLVVVDDASVTTEALAGSAELERADELAYRAKDRGEHARVVEGIEAGMRSAGLTPEVGSTVVRRLRSIAHLSTDIRAERRGAHVLDLVDRLHPTPATGGTPLPRARALIGELEGRPRGWYCGAVGWFDGAGRGAFFVALRSALIETDAMTVFVGGGVVPGSDPEAEWQETLLKERAVLRAFGLSEP